MSEQSLSSHAKRDAVEQALALIGDPAGEGGRAFTRTYADAARIAADSADRGTAIGMDIPSLAGMPISIKDLFDVKGEPTTAGSRILANAPAAVADAAVVARLRRAGAAIIGKTNMTEFAFSGLGINPHHGTPACAWDRPSRRIPGGSSSGAAISVSDGMAVAAIGTDTGGSCRIPAAFNGIVGFKPSAQTVPLTGALPLSPSYDSIGPLARDVETCARVYEVLSDSIVSSSPRLAETLTIGVVKNYVMDRVDAQVGKAFERTLRRLSSFGIELRDVNLPVLDALPDMFGNGGLVAAEAYQWHKALLDENEPAYDPRVAVRIRRGDLSSAADYFSWLKRRQALIAQWNVQIAPFDAIVMPTVPIVAPTIDSLADDESYGDINLLVLRNPTIVNVLDGCAISLPCHYPGEPPVGLMLAAANGRDAALLGMAKTLEGLLSMDMFCG